MIQIKLSNTEFPKTPHSFLKIHKTPFFHLTQLQKSPKIQFPPKIFLELALRGRYLRSASGQARLARLARSFAPIKSNCRGTLDKRALSHKERSPRAKKTRRAPLLYSARIRASGIFFEKRARASVGDARATAASAALAKKK